MYCMMGQMQEERSIFMGADESNRLIRQTIRQVFARLSFVESQVAFALVR